jgi:RNase P/RNase MRP subunit p29
MSAKLFLLAGATVLSLAVGSVGVAAVLPDVDTVVGEAIGRQGARIYGTIDDIENTTVTLNTPGGSVALITDVNTLYRIPGVEDPSLSDLAVGDAAGAIGWWEEDSNVFHAFVVAKLADDRTLSLAGELTEIGDDTLTIETRQGPATVSVNDETVYRIKEVEDPGLDDLEVGMAVIVRGTLQPDGTLLAKGVGAANVGPREGRLRGEITAIEGNTFTVRTGRREMLVVTDEATEFQVPGIENPTIADLKVGDQVAGEGTLDRGGTGSGEPVAHASLVVVLPDDVARLSGEVTAVTGDTLVLDTVTGSVDVLTDDDTVFRVRGVEDPSLADVQVGDHVTVAGSWADEATFHAIGVGIIGGQRPGQRGAVRGRAISIGADSLVVGTPRGSVTVVVEDDTLFRVAGVEDAGLGDIEEGDMVGARGTWSDDGSLLATGIAVLGERDPSAQGPDDNP